MNQLTKTVRLLGDTVATTLGPLGTSALVVQDDGSVETTAVGSEVLDLVSVDDPMTTVLERSLDRHEATTGDGGRSLLVVSTGLVERALDLVEEGLHPASVVAGYDEALTVALDRLAEVAFPLSTVGSEALVTTALTGVRDPVVREHLGDQLGDAAATMQADPAFDPRDVTVVSRLGDPLSETELLRGVVLDQEPVLETMPRTVDDAGVALLTATVDVQTLGGAAREREETTVTLQPGSFDDRVEVGDWERESFETAVDDAISAGCRVVLTTRAVNDRVKTALSRAGILAVQRVDESAAGRVARVTGAQPVPQLEMVDEASLGSGDVRVERKAGDDMVEVRSTANDPVYTLFCRAPDEQSLAAFERGVKSALASLLAVTTTDGGVVAGGGGAELAAARAVRQHARGVDGRRSLAIEAFGDALAAIPGQLAANAGMDRVTTVSRLRAAHAAGRSRAGVDALDRTVRDVVESDPVVDAEQIVRQRWTGATELGTQLVRVDDVIQATGGADA